MESSEASKISSPPWQPGTKLVVGVLLILLTVVILSLLRQLIPPFVISLLFYYLLHPLVTHLTRKWRLSRTATVLIVYLVLLLVFVIATTGFGLAVSQRVVQLAVYLGELSEALPAQIESLASLKLSIGAWDLDFSRVNLDPILSEVASIIQPLLSQTGILLGSIARTMASAITFTLLVLVLGYYMLLDFEDFDDKILELVPKPYRADIHRLIKETTRVWSAFIRGQAILAVVVGVAVGLILTGLRVRFPFALGLIAGLMEFVPLFGPLVAAVVTVLVAVFQGGNAWGLSPTTFGLLVLGIFLVIQQIENNILVPRIIGQSLNLRPIVVLLSILAGGVIAGVLGLLLAAPIVATLRVWLGYAYRKTVGLETWPSPSFSEAQTGPKKRIDVRGFLYRWQSILRRKGKESTEKETE